MQTDWLHKAGGAITEKIPGQTSRLILTSLVLVLVESECQRNYGEFPVLKIKDK